MRVVGWIFVVLNVVMAALSLYVSILGPLSSPAPSNIGLFENVRNLLELNGGVSLLTAVGIVCANRAPGRDQVALSVTDLCHN